MFDLVEKKGKDFLLIDELCGYCKIPTNHFQMSIEVLVIYVFRILHIVLIFVSKINILTIFYL
jgi:hypothetical protein